MVPTKLERSISKTNNGSSGNGNGNVGNGNNDNDRVIITEYYMDAMPESSYEPEMARTGVRWFYIDSISNIPWIIKKSLEKDGGGSPCSPGVVCFDLSKSKPRYDVCIPLN